MSERLDGRMTVVCRGRGREGEGEGGGCGARRGDGDYNGISIG
jgi:hypothetical protein